MEFYILGGVQNQLEELKILTFVGQLIHMMPV